MRNRNVNVRHFTRDMCLITKPSIPRNVCTQYSHAAVNARGLLGVLGIQPLLNIIGSIISNVESVSVQIDLFEHIRFTF